MLWSPNLQLYYPFENQANDYSGNARHGTVFGSGVYATRPNASRCLYFDGVGDYVQTPSFGLSGTVVVFAAWVRCAYNAATDQFIYQDGNYPSAEFNYCFRFRASNDLSWRCYDAGSHTIYSAANFFASPYNNVWVYMVIACDYAGKVGYFYRNGIPFGSPFVMTGTPVFPSTARVKYLGIYSNLSYPLTTGYLQGVQLWTLATCPPVAVLTANANRLMLGMNPIW